MSRTIRIMALILAYLPVSILAQNIVSPGASGSCPNGYFLYQGACVSSEALERLGAAEIARQLRNHLADSPSSRQSASTQYACEAKVDNAKDSVVQLSNGAVVEVKRRYLGYVGYRRDSLLFGQGSNWKLWIQGKDVYDVAVLRQPSRCSAPYSYMIEVSHNDDLFIINGERFEAKTFCLGWSQGDPIVFLEGSEYGACASATLLNINNSEICEVWCE